MVRAFQPILLALFILLIAIPAYALKPVHTATLSNTAVEGYDTVAYFTKSALVMGSDDYKTQYKGAVWKFSSADHLALFKADPDMYTPQYGGYCAYAVAQNTTASGDPKQWSIVDGKLYLNYNADIKKRWAQDIPGYIARADKNWPLLLTAGRTH